MGDWKRGVVSFDVDGTLTDTAKSHILFCNDINREFNFGIKQVDPEDTENVRGVLANPMSTLLRNYGFPERKIKELDHLYAERFPKNPKYASSPFPGVEEMLRELKNRELYLLALSSNTLSNIQRDLGEANWNLFDAHIARESLQRFYQGSKGIALQILLAQQFGNIPPRGVLHTGDTENDYQATNVAQCRFMAAGYGWQLRTSDERFPVAANPGELTIMIARAFI